MKKLAKIFSSFKDKNDYREKDQRIVSRWLKELEEEKLDADEVMNLCLRFVVSCSVSIYGATTQTRKSVIARLDFRMKEAIKAIQLEVKNGKFHNE